MPGKQLKIWRRRLLIGAGAAFVFFVMLEGYFWYAHAKNGDTAHNAADTADSTSTLPKSSGVNAIDDSSLQTDLKAIDAALVDDGNNQNTADKALDDHAGQLEGGTLALLQSRGDSEIGRRITALNGAILAANSTDNLSPQHRQALFNEAGNETTNLILLRVSLKNTDTTTAAHGAITSLADEYRVYAFVVPKIHLVAVAGFQATVEQKLASLAGKIGDRLAQAKDGGKDVAALQASLHEMDSHITAAEQITKDTQTALLPLQPADYNDDHKILQDYRGKLKTAREHNQAAYQTAKKLLAALRSL